MESITFNELLKALEEAGIGKNGEGFTVTEFCVANQMSAVKARSLVRKAIGLGLLRATRKTITDMSGRNLPVASYVQVKRRPKK
jgi:hypothetical protein